MSYDQGLVIFTARNSSCGKVMFLQVSVCPQRGLYPACNRAGGCVSQHAIGKGVCDQGVRQGGGGGDQGVCDWGCTPPSLRSTSGRYAIYWNAFLLKYFAFVYIMCYGLVGDCHPFTGIFFVH